MATAWDTGLPTTETIVLLALADWANADAEAWPSIASICGKTRLSERAVRIALRKLEAAGHLTTRQVRGKSARYVVHPTIGDPGTSCPRHVMPPAPDAETPAPRAPKPLRTTIPKKAPLSQVGARPKNAVEALPDLPPTITAEQWSDFVEMRRAMERGPKKRPWTPGAAKGIIRDLHKIAAAGDSPGEALERSTANGWAGVLFEKDNRHGNERSRDRGNRAPRYGSRGSVDGFGQALREMSGRSHADDDSGG